MSDTCCSCHGAQSGLCDDCCECETLTFKALNERVQRLEAQNEIKKILTAAAGRHKHCKGNKNCLRAVIGEAWPKINKVR